ncbi:histidine phosphatase family protein [Mobilicoccus caccae]|uniref:Isomerase n=1 Tax=Mobilicoccus caccae TaxID=1859295 RepID=A0ABQ6IU80_9MICO|nr:histidine phosphatase family protein [Mobilicoccus caccae]GMA41029.1 isomerase [Mobilicoccus caccae]
MRLFLVRHGQTTSNIGHHLDTAIPGADLSDRGRRQAEAIPAALADESIDLIVVSDLVRTQQTAAPLARSRGMEPWIRGGIREISAGDLEMRNDHDAIEEYIEGVFDWDTDPDVRVANGETGREVMARFDEVVEEVAREVGDGTALLVSHGAVIRVWAALRCENIDLAYAADHWVPNTAMLTLVGDPDTGWRMEAWLEEPLGGHDLDSEGGPTGEPEDEATDED